VNDAECDCLICTNWYPNAGMRWVPGDPIPTFPLPVDEENLNEAA
jgi:hypothetical protein